MGFGAGDEPGRLAPIVMCKLARDSDVMVDQTPSWDNALFRKDLGLLPNALQDEVRAALKEFLDL